MVIIIYENKPSYLKYLLFECKGMKKTHIFAVINLISQLMNKLFRQIGLTFILLVAISLGSCTSKYSYETVPNDPLKARIYTLDNGATVVVRPSGTEPKIKTYFTTLGKDLAEAQAQKDALAAAIEPILA